MPLLEYNVGGIYPSQTTEIKTGGCIFTTEDAPTAIYA